MATTASGFTLKTELGDITLQFRRDAAPETVTYIETLIQQHRLYDGTSFYRSDFVIQCGTYDGLKKLEDRPINPLDKLHVNETHMHVPILNTRGTASFAHWDVPDCGNTEWFINLRCNTHLDTVYGGYCVFAEIIDNASFKVVDAIADVIASGKKKTVTITSVVLITT
jgi:cyclophilin family peptidyl-prolyl cis-trans isomerase